MSLKFGIQNGTSPAKALWNYNNQKTLANGGAYFDASTMNIASGVNVPIGTLLHVDLSTRKAFVVKNALIITGGTTSAPRVNKNHFFVAGDFVYCSGAAVSITSIDTSNSAYDVLTLSGACDGASAGVYLENASASGASPSLKYSPNAILGEKVYNVQGSEAITAVGWVFEDINTSFFPIAISPLQISNMNATGRFLMY